MGEWSSAGAQKFRGGRVSKSNKSNHMEGWAGVGARRGEWGLRAGPLRCFIMDNIRFCLGHFYISAQFVHLRFNPFRDGCTSQWVMGHGPGLRFDI
jgi:hypothetical protein